MKELKLPLQKEVTARKCDCGKELGRKYPFTYCNGCLQNAELEAKKCFPNTTIDQAELVKKKKK